MQLHVFGTTIDFHFPDKLALGALGGLIVTHLAQINQVVQIIAGLLTAIAAAVSLFSRLRKKAP